MPTVILRDGESQQKLLSRFRTKITRSGVLSQYRKKRWHMPKSEQNRIDKKNARRKIMKSQRRGDDRAQ